MKVHVDVVTITPAKAAEYLENLMDGQRKLRESWVKSLADDMRAGRFTLSPDALVLIKGKLANGQHRMWGVVEADLPMPFLLMRTDDEELYKVIDSGLKRTVGDAVNLPNSARCAAVAIDSLGYDLNYLTPLSVTKKVTRVQQIEYLEKYQAEISDAVNLICRLTALGQVVCARGTGATFAVLARRLQGEKADAFLHHLYLGDVTSGVTFDLREKLLRMRGQKAKYPRQYTLALLIKAFNAYLKGTKLSDIRIRDGEPFPRIVGG